MQLGIRFIEGEFSLVQFKESLLEFLGDYACSASFSQIFLENKRQSNEPEKSTTNLEQLVLHIDAVFIDTTTNSQELETLLHSVFSKRIKIEYRGLNSSAMVYYMKSISSIDLLLVDIGHEDFVYELEMNVDNIPPEKLATYKKMLLQAGALDCWIEAIQMKKDRPAHKLSLLVDKQSFFRISRLILTYIPTLGFRYSEKKRLLLYREDGSGDDGGGGLEKHYYDVKGDKHSKIEHDEWERKFLEAIDF